MGDKEKELKKTRKLLAEAERIRKVKAWSGRMLGQSKQPTLGKKEKELRAMAQAEGLMNQPARDGAAARLVGARKLAVPAKSKV